jgi:hypothetical protein
LIGIKDRLKKLKIDIKDLRIDLMRLNMRWFKNKQMLIVLKILLLFERKSLMGLLMRIMID